MSTNNSWNNAISAANSAITLNSGTNAIGISTDASVTTVNVGSGAAAKTVVVGSTNTTSALTLNSGSGGIKAVGVSGVTVANKNYMSINTSTGTLGSDSGPTVGQMVLIATKTASASSTLDFTSGITSTYGTYFISVSSMLLSAAGINLNMVVSDNGGSSYLSSTYTAGYNSTGWNGATWTNVNSTALSTIGRSTAGGTSGAISGYLYIFNLATSDTATWMGRFFSGNTHYVVFGACTTSSLNAIRFQLSSGTMTSGSISLYGIKNS